MYSVKFFLLILLNFNYFKVEQVVICNLTPLQKDLYKLFCKSNNIDELEEESGGLFLNFFYIYHRI